jgi:hypothetical protein
MTQNWVAMVIWVGYYGVSKIWTLVEILFWFYSEGGKGKEDVCRPVAAFLKKYVGLVMSVNRGEERRVQENTEIRNRLQPERDWPTM